MSVKYVVRNKEKLFRKLKQMDDQIEKEVQAAALKGAEEVAAMAANLAPKNPATPSDYAGSINAKPVTTISGNVFNSAIGAGKIKARKGQRAITDGQAAAGVFAKFVWRFIEYGTINNPPYPHMTVAYRALKKRIQGRMSRAIGKAVKRIAAR